MHSISLGEHYPPLAVGPATYKGALRIPKIHGGASLRVIKLGGELYKENILDIAQDFNARYMALRATISPNTNFDPIIIKKIISITILL